MCKEVKRREKDRDTVKCDRTNLIEIQTIDLKVSTMEQKEEVVVESMRIMKYKGMYKVLIDSS